MEKLKIKQIVFTKVNTAEFLEMDEFDISNLDKDSVVVKTEYSTISCGTERANISGDKNVAPDTDNVPPFPRMLGYSSCGTVVATGTAVNNVSVGDRVVVFWGKHKNYNISDKNNVVKIPDGIDMQDAALAFICAFSLAAIRKVKLEIGESCMIMGLGLLGQLAVKLAKLGGAYPVIACDMNEERRDFALQNGADYAFNPLDKDFSDKVKEITNGGANTAIEVTGVGAGLNEVLDCMAKFGRVALLGCTRSSDFTIDYYKKVHSPGITLVGAHTMARPNLESSPNMWTHNDDISAVLNLCKGNRISLKDIVKEVHSPEECFSVYSRLVSDRSFPIGVQFRW